MKARMMNFRMVSFGFVIIVSVTAWARPQPGARSIAPVVDPIASVDPAHAGGEVLKEIDDPHSGDRWLLLRDDRHPGGPGRLVIAARATHLANSTPEAVLPPAIIRSGDSIVVEQNTAVLNALLEATALAPATAGSCFNARLRMGGQVVRAVAIAPGRAELIEETSR